MMDLIKPKIRCLEQGDRYGKFLVEPLERGYGTTLGSSLRRVLLSSIVGWAVTSVKIEGVQHEFSTLPGVSEDTIEMIMNVKELAVRRIPVPEEDALHAAGSGEPRIIKIQARGEGEVTGADVITPPDLQIVNSDLHIATLTTQDAMLNIEMTVQAGKGYVPTDKQSQRLSQVIGVIPIDAVYTPVRKVNMMVEPTRVGHKSDYDRLVLEVWTNGAIKPEDSISEAAKVLDRYLQLFFDFVAREEEEKKIVQDQVREKDRILEYRIDDLDFSVRTNNCLKKEGVSTLGQLIQKTKSDLIEIRNFGRKSLDEVQEKLTQFNMQLRDPESEDKATDLDEDELAADLGASD